MSTTITHLAERAIAIAQQSPRTVIGLVGPPGAGKTTLARALVDEIRAAVREDALGAFGRDMGGPDEHAVVQVPMDGYHLADIELERLGFLDRKGAPETFDAEGYRSLLERIRRGSAETIYAPAFERMLEQPIAGSLPVHPETRIVVTEGNYLLLDTEAWRPVREQCNEIWYCQQDDDLRTQRLISRHIEFGKNPEAAKAWVNDVDEANARLVRDSKAQADLIVDLDALLLEPMS